MFFEARYCFNETYELSFDSPFGWVPIQNYAYVWSYWSVIWPTKQLLSLQPHV